VNPNAQLLERFYTAFAARDGETMAACYHPDAAFSDPVFTQLRGPRAGHMWRMLTERGADLEIVFSGIEADDTRGKAHWEATYTFSATGRKVHNVIDATFRFEDGHIREHQDVFDFYAWTRMALGPMGVLLGWSGFLQNKVRDQAETGLQKWESKHAG
jgi:ketosteroid isomerase-like protein